MHIGLTVELSCPILHGVGEENSLGVTDDGTDFYLDMVKLVFYKSMTWFFYIEPVTIISGLVCVFRASYTGVSTVNPLNTLHTIGSGMSSP